MSITMYQATIPVFIRMLNNISAVLKKAVIYAETKNIDPSVLINARLAPDMFALGRQIQIATDTAKGCAARLAGVEIPVYTDTESTFTELDERIAKTINFLNSVTPAQIDGSEQKDIMLKIRGEEIHFAGLIYVTGFALPNFYFHISMTYAILRHNGLDIGKRDYLGSI